MAAMSLTNGDPSRPKKGHPPIFSKPQILLSIREKAYGLIAADAFCSRFVRATNIFSPRWAEIFARSSWRQKIAKSYTTAPLHWVGDGACTRGGTQGRGIRSSCLREGRVRFDDTPTLTGWPVRADRSNASMIVTSIKPSWPDGSGCRSRKMQLEKYRNWGANWS
jgi:hypothetical protein